MCNLKTVLRVMHFNYLLFSVNTQMFFKHHYEVIFERAQVDNLNRSVAIVTASILLYNRTSRPLTLKFQLLKELHEDSAVFFKGYQFKSNEYRLTAVQFAMHLRKALKFEVGGFDSLLKEAVPPIIWPLETKVTYVVKNWLPNNNNMPFPYAPVGKWKDVISFYMDNKITKVFDLVLYFRIEDIPDL